MECEHLDGNLMGKCAICGDMVCGECFQSIFNSVICSNHKELEDEGEWELMGFFTDSTAAEERRYFLSEQSLTSIVVEGDDDLIEFYVPVEEKEDAYNALLGPSEDVVNCENCQVLYSAEIEACPICGARNVDQESTS